jgi:uncharacterized repeat protein (TIGR04138 family)
MSQDPPFRDFVARALRRDPRYHPLAYELVRDALHVAMKKFRGDGGESHVSGQQVLEGLRTHCLSEYGPMALTVLDTWGIHESLDVGNIVYNLIDAGFFFKSANDSLEDFKGLDLRDALSQPYQPRTNASTS